MRLDKYLVEQGSAKSRERAKNLIENNQVLVNGKIVRKANLDVCEDARVEVKGADIPWVSRAGLKLVKAFETWPINAKGKVCLDIGASTGGFTEVLLDKGAKKVYALDVGTNQLAQKLQNDPRVINLEKTNIIDVGKSSFTEPIDFISIDVSFVSLNKVLPKIAEILDGRGVVIALIKPQFEVGKDRIGKGIITDPSVHKEIIERIGKFAKSLGLKESGLIESPILGSKGNKEFLIYLRKITKSS